jgi:hypothetical protein
MQPVVGDLCVRQGGWAGLAISVFTWVVDGIAWCLWWDGSSAGVRPHQYAGSVALLSVHC